MNIAERILLSLSRTPNGNDNFKKDAETNIDNALNLLIHTYSNFRALISGKYVVDF